MQATLRRFRSLNRDLLLIYLSVFLWGFGLYFYYYLQPLYVTSLGATPAQVGLVLGTGGLVTAILFAPIGLLADRFGRKTVMVSGWSIGAAAAFGMALAPNWQWFIVALSFYTLSSFAVPVVYAYLTAITLPEQRASIFALVASGPSAGSILAPAIGGWIGEHYGLRATYFAAACIFALSALCIALVRSQPAEPTANRANAQALLGDRNFLRQLLFTLLVYFAIDVGVVLAPKFLQEVRGFSVAQIGWLGTVNAVGVVIISLAIGRIRGEGRLALVLSQLCMLLALPIVIFVPTFSWVALAYSYNGGNRLIRPPLLVRLSRLLNPATMSFGLGLQNTASQIGLALSPYVAGLLYAQNPTWPLIAGIIALGATLILTQTLIKTVKA